MRTGRTEESPLKVFMLGWEFPPFISGGLGTACYGLTKAMDQIGIRVTFVLPRAVQDRQTTHVRLLTPQSTTIYRYPKTSFKHVKFYSLPAYLQPYARPDAKQHRLAQILQQKGLEHLRTAVGTIEI
ncbi:MAG: glycogen/starch synthase, partial [Sedimentisphaerales bacterium]|nr:glycogen/starch synthase [Sedimentisphaerales bacterium]